MKILFAKGFLKCKRNHISFRSSPPERFLRKGVLKICSKYMISIKLQGHIVFSEHRFLGTLLECCFQHRYDRDLRHEILKFRVFQEGAHSKIA